MPADDRPADAGPADEPPADQPPRRPAPDEKEPRACLTISVPRDLVALVPYRLGYHPRDSLVLLCLRGRRPRVGLVMRVDLPGAADLPAVVAALARHAVDDGAAAVVAVLYRHGSLAASTVPDVAGVLADAGIELQEAWQVGARRLWSLTCRDPDCCPADGWPVEVLQSAQVSAEMVARGRAVAPSRSDLAGDLEPVDRARRRVVARLVARHAGARPGAGEPLAAWRRAGLETWRRALRDPLPASEVPGPVAAVLLAGLCDVVVRDAVLLDCVPGAREAADELVAAGSGRTADALHGVFTARAAVEPDEALQHRADAVLRSLVRQGTGATRAAPLGALAWSAWWAGDGGRSSVLTELALAADPEHRLALLISAALDAGLAPGWAQRDRMAQAR